MENTLKSEPHPITNIIGRDAREVTKRNPPKFQVKTKTSWTPHIAWMSSIEKMGSGFLR